MIGEPDCIYSYWSTDSPQRFDDAQVETLTGLMPALTLAIKLRVEVRVLRRGQSARVKVTAAEFTFVALDENGHPCPVNLSN